MENKRPLIIAVGCFLTSLLLISAYVKLRRYQLTRDFGEEVSVVVAAQDIREFSHIKPEMLQVISVFKKFVQPQTVSRIRDIVGKAAYVPLYRGEQVTLTKLIQSDAAPVLDREISKNMRAVTLTISPFSGVGRLVRPGNYVDILGSPTYDSNGQTLLEVGTLVQNVLVLATGKNIENDVPSRVNRRVLTYLQETFESDKRKDYFGNIERLNSSRPDDNYTTLTVQVGPTDAERLLYMVRRYGDRSLYFSLRNRADNQPVSLSTALLDDVLGPNSDYGRSKRKPPPPPPPTRPRYFDIQGGQQVTPQ